MDKATEDVLFQRYSRANDAQFRLCALVGAIDAALEGDARQDLLDEVMRRAVDAAATARGNLPQVAAEADWVARCVSNAQFDLDALDKSIALRRLGDSRYRAVSALGLAALEAARALDAMPSPCEEGADGD